MHRSFFAVRQDFQQRRAFPFAPVGRQVPADFLFRNRCLCHAYGFNTHPSAAHLRRQHQAQRFSQRAVRLYGHFLRQGHQLRRNRRVVLQRPYHFPQFLCRYVAFIRDFNDNAFLFSPSERNSHPLPRAKFHALRNQVGKRFCHILMNDVHDHPAIHPFPSFPGIKHHLLLYRFLPDMTTAIFRFPAGQMRLVLL